MKNILICQHGGSGNHGCEALARTVVGLLRQAEPDCRITLYTYHLSEDHRYLSDLGVEIRGLRSLPGKVSPYNLYYHVRRIARRPVSKLPLTAEFRRLVDESDLVIAIGGDNYCYKMGQGYYALDAFIKSRGKKYMLLGCSVEPEDLRRGLARHLQLFDCITVRERISYDAMQQAGLQNLVLAADSAFLLETERCDLPEGFKPEMAVGINFSPLVIENEKTPGMTLENFKTLALYILKRTDLQLALISHVAWHGNDDRRALAQLYDAISGYGDRVFLLPDMGAQQIKYVISRLQFFIGARTHATIAAYSSAVPTLTLGYSVKARGIAADLFGTEKGYVLPVQDLDRPDQLLQAFKPLFARKDTLHTLLETRLPAYRLSSAAVVEAVRRVLARTEPETFAALTSDENIRAQSSSGGVFGSIAAQVIRHGGRVVAAAFDGDMKLRHMAADTLEQLWPLLGSKYVVSDLAPAMPLIRESITQGRETLFCGTPCQATAVRTALQSNPLLRIVEVVCHGTPLPDAFEAYKSELEKKYGAKLTSFRFRDKRTGWQHYSVTATFEDGAEYSVPQEQDPYMKLFLHNLILRESCYDCHHKRHSAADLTIGDFWGLKYYAPELNDDKGVTLAIVRTEAGKQLLEQTDGLTLRPVSPAGIERYNPCLTSSVPRPSARNQVPSFLHGTPIRELARQFIAEPGFVARQKIRLRRLLQK